MIEVYGKDNCVFCTKAVNVLETRGVPYGYYKLGTDLTIPEFVEKFPGVKTVPVVIVNGFNIGGYTELVQYLEETTNGSGDDF